MSTISFPELLRKTRTDWKITQEDFAFFVNVSGKYISAIENGRKIPERTKQKIQKIIDLGATKTLELLSKKQERVKTVKTASFPDTYNCLPLIRAIARCDCKILNFNDFVFLLKIQLQLINDMSSQLIVELLGNRYNR